MKTATPKARYYLAAGLVLALVLGFLAISVAGRGGSDVSADEVPGAAPELKIPKSPGSTGDPLATNNPTTPSRSSDSDEDDATPSSSPAAANGGAPAEAAPSPEQSKTGGASPTGEPAQTEAKPAPKEADKPTPAARPGTSSSDKTGGAAAPADDGATAGTQSSQAKQPSRFEQFCRDNPGAC